MHSILNNTPIDLKNIRIDDIQFLYGGKVFLQTVCVILCSMHLEATPTVNIKDECS